MPIYEYQCRDCKQVFEEWQTDFKDREMKCPVCGGSADRLISNTSFILKGGGWYVTDYGKGSGGSNGKQAKTSASSSTSDTSSSSAGSSSSSSSDT